MALLQRKCHQHNQIKLWLPDTDGALCKQKSIDREYKSISLLPKPLFR